MIIMIKTEITEEQDISFSAISTRPKAATESQKAYSGSKYKSISSLLQDWEPNLYHYFFLKKGMSKLKRWPAG